MLDAAGNVATARVNSLERYYTLGILGPFQQSTFNFPVLGSIRDYFTGLALVNLGTESSELKFTVYDGAGQVAANATEAISTTTLAPSAQFPRLAPEIFKFTGSVQDGWIQMRSSKSSVIAFELLGNAAVLDGVAVPSIGNAAIVLTGMERDGAFDTELHVANPTTFSNFVTLELRSEAGAKIGTAQRTLAPRAKWTGVLRALFPQAPASGFRGYVVVRGSQALSTVSLTYSPSSLAALSGQRQFAQKSEPSRLFSAQLASGAGVFYTRLNLVNPTTLDATITLRAVGEDGSDLAAAVSVTLPAGRQYNRDVKDIFGFAASQLRVGSIVVESSVTGIVGDVTFGDASTAARFRASLPLDREPSRLAAFGHVGNGGGFYTGLAVFNPSDVPADLVVKVYKADGTLTGNANLTLAPRRRFSRLLPELVAASAGQLGGYFTVESDQPVSSFALFGTLDLSALSAIPAQQAGR